MADEKWFRQRVGEFREPWFSAMSPGARIAWIYLKAHVCVSAPSHISGNQARALGPRAAAQVWNLPESEIREMLQAAVEAGKLATRDGRWIVLDRSAFIVDWSSVRRREREKVAGRIPPRLRRDVLAIGRCEYCGRPDRLTVDHIVPISKGGDSRRENLQCLCKPCNSRKGNR